MAGSLAKGPASRRAQNRRQARDSQALTSLVLGNFERDALSKGLDKRKAARCRGRALHDLPHRPSKYSTSACCFSGATNFYRPASSTRTLWIHLRCQAARLKARKGGKPGDFCPATKQTSRSQGRRQSPPRFNFNLTGLVKASHSGRLRNNGLKATPQHLRLATRIFLRRRVRVKLGASNPFRLLVLQLAAQKSVDINGSLMNMRSADQPALIPGWVMISR